MKSLQGTLPGYTLGEGCVLDLRYMPPAVAEVYTIAVLQYLQRGRNPRCRAHLEMNLFPAVHSAAPAAGAQPQVPCPSEW